MSYKDIEIEPVNEQAMANGLLDLDFVPPGASVVSMATHRLSRLLRRELGELLSRQGNIGLPGWRIYVGLASLGDVTQKELVEFTKIEQGQISRSLAFMEDDGLISSRRCNDDRRSRRFALTAKGRNEFERILPSVAAYCDAVDCALSESELNLFLSMAERIARTANEVAGHMPETEVETI